MIRAACAAIGASLGALMQLRSPVAAVADALAAGEGDFGSASLTVCPQCALPREKRSLEPLCPACRTEPPPWRAMVALGPYEGAIGSAVRRMKAGPWPELGGALGPLLATQLARRLSAMMPGLLVPRRVSGAAGTANTPPVTLLLVPVPTHLSRVVWRGIDHPRVIATAMREELVRQLPGAEAETCAFLTRKWGAKQQGYSAWRRRRRLTNTMRVSVLGALRLRLLGRRLGPSVVGNAHQSAAAKRIVVAVVVDDVVTTGSTARETLRAGRAALRRAGIRPTMWVVATVTRVDLRSE